MKDNLSLVITMLVLVLLLIIFPLYNNFQRQDNMSTNVVLKATTMFVDDVLNSGYIDQKMYDDFVTELANTGVVYDIELEAHKKVFTNALNSNDTKIEQFVIDYNNDIFKDLDVASSNLNAKSLKNDVYKFNEGDKFYVRVKNSNTTMAGAIFSAILPSSSKTRISANYGGIVKNVAWKKVDATYIGHNFGPSVPELTIIDVNGKLTKLFGDKNDIKLGVNSVILAHSTSTNLKGENVEIEKYTWNIKNICDPTTKAIETTVGKLPSSTYDFKNGTFNIKVSATDINGLVSDVCDVTVSFTTNFLVTVNVAKGHESRGTVTGAGYYELDKMASISSIANQNYIFDYWTINNDENNKIFQQNFSKKVTQDITYTAYFKENKFQVTVNVAKGHESCGTVTGAGNYDLNGMASISSTANKNYALDYWIINNDENNKILNDEYNTNKILYQKVTQDITYTAYFKEKIYEAKDVAKVLVKIEKSSGPLHAKSEDSSYDKLNVDENSSSYNFNVTNDTKCDINIKTTNPLIYMQLDINLYLVMKDGNSVNDLSEINFPVYFDGGYSTIKGNYENDSSFYNVGIKMFNTFRKQVGVKEKLSISLTNNFGYTNNTTCVNGSNSHCFSTTYYDVYRNFYVSNGVGGATFYINYISVSTGNLKIEVEDTIK